MFLGKLLYSEMRKLEEKTMKFLQSVIAFAIIFALISCTGNENTSSENPPIQLKSFNYLALGDSYTIGESVCETCRFPEQLKKQLSENLNATISLQIIAKTGWTTGNLKTAITTENPSNNYDLVTLLIGVNNQYQHKPFSEYQTEFPELLAKAIALAKGDKTNVVVVSIPDYAFTPFGNGNSAISTEIDNYNEFAKNHAEQSGIAFVNITDITRQGLINPDLVASDRLHPSELAYSKFTELLLPISISILNK